jgi:flavodoxin I
MSKAIIVYDTFTGNTEAMAKAIAEGIGKGGTIEVELYKLGTRFPMSTLNDADAIILGSPTEYGNVTSAMRVFLESVSELKAARKLNLRKKVGGVFGSYTWDGGWVVEMLGLRLKRLGVRVIPPIVSAPAFIDMGKDSAEPHLQKCRELGRAVVMAIPKS